MNKTFRKITSCVSALALAFSVTAFSDADIVDTEVSAAAPSNQYEGHTYKVFNKSVSWTEAQKQCEKLGGHLVTIGSSGEQKFIEKLIANEECSDYWIGLKSKGKSWEWVDKTAYKYKNWDVQSPDSSKGTDYAAVSDNNICYESSVKSLGKWDDYSNTANLDPVYNFGYICEWDYKKSVSPERSDNKTTTIMIYITGTNLESINGIATDELKEIVNGYTGNKNVNIIIQTGGSKFWYNKNVSEKTGQRYKVEKGGIKLIKDMNKQLDMGDPDTLESFISFCRTNYKADRYGLVLWNHGGASLGGVCSDEMFNNDSLHLDELRDAIDDSGTKFDFVGFDACLMSSLETAFALSGRTKYIVASENNEVGIGWYYTDWIKALCDDPTMTTKALCKNIVDSTENKCAKEIDAVQILSVIDTNSVVKNVMPALSKYSKNADKMLSDGKFADFAKSRAVGYISGSLGFEVIDILNMYDKVSGYSELKNAVNKSIYYTNKTQTSTELRGLSITLPYEYPEDVDRTIGLYKELGYGSHSYVKFVKHFANIIVGAYDHTEYLGTSYRYKNCSWYDPKQAYSDSYYKKMLISENGELDTTEDKDGNVIFKLTDSQLSGVVYAETEISARDYDDYMKEYIRYYYSDTSDIVDLGKNRFGVNSKAKCLYANGGLIYSEYLGYEYYYDSKGKRHTTDYFIVPAEIYDSYWNEYRIIQLTVISENSSAPKIIGYSYSDTGMTSRTFSLGKNMKFKYVYWIEKQDGSSDYLISTNEFTASKSGMSLTNIGKYSDLKARYIITDIFGITYRSDYFDI